MVAGKARTFDDTGGAASCVEDSTNGQQHSMRAKEPSRNEMANSTEQLLTATDAARKLGISRTTFYKILAPLKAKGVKTVKIRSLDRYVESTIDEVIRKASETERPLC